MEILELILKITSSTFSFYLLLKVSKIQFTVLKFVKHGCDRISDIFSRSEISIMD